MKGRSYTVSECTWHIKNLLENDPSLQEMRVSGEVSNLTYHRSGHVYFSMKDPQAALSCVMFRSDAQRAEKMALGDKVVVTGFITVYAPRGNYQMRVVRVEKEGQGDLYQQFLALKDRLNREGLFDVSLKRRPPMFPKRIAILTSPTGAALQDMLRTINRRFPAVAVTVVPTVVQGANGAASIVRSLQRAQDTDAEVIILGRGGGSLEDLWNFNEESVARAIRASSIPVISGVGHETDVTIADFVADLRASTPTAAAEHAVPDLQDLLDRLNGAEDQIKRSLRYFIDFKGQMLDEYSLRLEQSIRQFIRKKSHEVDLLESKLNGLDQRTLLKRGYTLTLKEGKIVTSATEVTEGDTIDTVFQDGRKSSRILTPDNRNNS